MTGNHKSGDKISCWHCFIPHSRATRAAFCILKNSCATIFDCPFDGKHFSNKEHLIKYINKTFSGVTPPKVTVYLAEPSLDKAHTQVARIDHFKPQDDPITTASILQFNDYQITNTYLLSLESDNVIHRVFKHRSDL